MRTSFLDATLFSLLILGTTHLFAATPHANQVNLQAGSFRSASNAKSYQQQLLNTIDSPVTIVADGIYQVVLIGPLAMADAKALKNKIDGSVIKKNVNLPVKDKVASKATLKKHKYSVFRRPTIKNAVSLRQTFNLQVGSFRSESNAKNYQQHLLSTLDYPVSVVKQGIYHVVLVGPLEMADAKILQHKMKGAVIRKNANMSPIINSFFAAKKQDTPFVTLSGGPAWYNAGNRSRQTFYLQPTVEKTYDGRVSNQPLAEGEVFLGLQRLLNQQLWGQLGIAVVTSSNADLSGDIWEDADPAFNNYIYDYKIRHTHVALKGKLLADYGQVAMPYFSGSIGVGFNRAHDYTSTHKIFQEVSAPNFQDHTKTSLTYTLGVGIQKNLNEHLQYGLGYEFADWGKIQLERASGQTLNTGLNLPNFYTNLLQFSISYIV